MQRATGERIVAGVTDDVLAAFDRERSDFLAALDRGLVATNPVADVTATKVGFSMSVSTDMAMDYGLIPDTRPPRPLPSRWQRLRWTWRDKRQSARMRLASWIAGFDVEDV